MFNTYFQIGLQHIADITAYDHILFIVALCAMYRLFQWKTVLILVTAFTIGHSITLALAALDIVAVNSAVIEFLIPLTIFITAIYNVTYGGNENSSSNAVRFDRFKYMIALSFGLIHGMGFSNYFKSLLGREANITMPLFAFNVGIEIGQIIIVAFILAASFLFMEILKTSQKSWNTFVSGAAAGIAVILMMETWPF